MTMWNNVILCLGSNTDCEANLKSAASLLRAYFGSMRQSRRLLCARVLAGASLLLRGRAAGQNVP